MTLSEEKVRHLIKVGKTDKEIVLIALENGWREDQIMKTLHRIRSKSKTVIPEGELVYKESGEGFEGFDILPHVFGRSRGPDVGSILTSKAIAPATMAEIAGSGDRETLRSMVDAFSFEANGLIDSGLGKKDLLKKIDELRRRVERM
jgi:hypothetical protein